MELWESGIMGMCVARIQPATLGAYITMCATILGRPAQDGSSLTFTVWNPDDTAASSFFRIKFEE